jgi:hypothetical protein
MHYDLLVFERKQHAQALLAEAENERLRRSLSTRLTFRRWMSNSLGALFIIVRTRLQLCTKKEANK